MHLELRSWKLYQDTLADATTDPHMAPLRLQHLSLPCPLTLDCIRTSHLRTSTQPTGSPPASSLQLPPWSSSLQVPPQNPPGRSPDPPVLSLAAGLPEHSFCWSVPSVLPLQDHPNPWSAARSVSWMLAKSCRCTSTATTSCTIHMCTAEPLVNAHLQHRLEARLRGCLEHQCCCCDACSRPLCACKDKLDPEFKSRNSCSRTAGDM